VRAVYATTLELRASSDVSAALNYVGRWIQDWYHRQRHKVEVFENLAAGDLTVAPVEGHLLAIRHHIAAESSGTTLVDVDWSYPDQYDKSLGWVVSLALLRAPEQLLLSLTVSVRGLKLVVAPARVKLGSPRVVRDIGRLRSLHLGGKPYRITPELVDAEYVELLVDELKDPTRTHPIVLVSRGLQDDIPLTNSTDLAERLAGVAKVYELADKWAAFRLTEEVGKALSCYGGAVRLYWPGFNPQHDPFSHPLWMPWDFKDATSSERALGHLSSLIFDAAAFRHVEPLAIGKLRSAAEREARQAVRGTGTKSEAELLDELIEMEDKLKVLEAANAELLQDNQTLRDNAAALAAHSNWNKSYAPPEESFSEVSEPAPPKDVREAVDQAAGAKHVRFLPSAYSSASDSPFKNPVRVREALVALEEVAAIWAETVGSGKAAGSLRDHFKKRGFPYADDISKTTKGKWGKEYSTTYQGQELDIAPHITLGSGQPDTCLSIHWAWYEDEKVALVAHVGRHKTNTKT